MLYGNGFVLREKPMSHRVEEARQIACKFGAGSNEWLQKWKNRHSIAEFRTARED